MGKPVCISLLQQNRTTDERREKTNLYVTADQPPALTKRRSKGCQTQNEGGMTWDDLHASIEATVGTLAPPSSFVLGDR